jgi:predicted fused transcriptional regulator/phosphomethylpyrimidine kinase/predicted transcriptional regulator
MLSEKTPQLEIPSIKFVLPCEIVTEHLLPLIRREFSLELINRRGLSQLQVAKILGVTQPAVSNYLHSNPKLNPELMRGYGEIKRLVRDLSDDLLRGILNQVDAIGGICSVCLKMRNRGPICSIHSVIVNDLKNDRCTVCMVDFAGYKNRSREDYEIIEGVRQALMLIEESRELAPLIPEIGMNITFAKSDPKDTSDVVGIPGRIRSVGGKPRAASNPEFGGSSHVARAVLSMMRFHPTLRSAISLKYYPELIEICKKIGITVSFFDRSEEPTNIKDVDGLTIPWGIEQAMKKSSGIPTLIYDTGGIGKEPMIFLFGTTPQKVARLARKISLEYMRYN